MEAEASYPTTRETKTGTSSLMLQEATPGQPTAFNLKLWLAKALTLLRLSTMHHTMMNTKQPKMRERKTMLILERMKACILREQMNSRPLKAGTRPELLINSRETMEDTTERAIMIGRKPKNKSNSNNSNSSRISNTISNTNNNSITNINNRRDNQSKNNTSSNNRMTCPI